MEEKTLTRTRLRNIKTVQETVNQQTPYVCTAYLSPAEIIVNGVTYSFPFWETTEW